MFKDKYAVAKIKQLIEDFGVKTVVETGTYRGEGVLGFSKLMDNVYSIEIDEVFWEETKGNLEGEGYIPLLIDLSFLPMKIQSLARKSEEEKARIKIELEKKMSILRDKPINAERVKLREELFPLDREDVAVYVKGEKRITLILGNSPEVMEKIIEELPEPILFFFDAHWTDYWPLLDELRVIKARPNSLIIIDDFKVPGKPFGYDTYKGIRLDWNLVKEPLTSINSNYRIFFNEEAAGDYRGVIYAVPEAAKTELGDLEWTMEDYEEVYHKLTKAGLPGEMAGHIEVSECFHCQFIEDDQRVLRELVSQIAKEGVMVAEIGSWMGTSTLVLAKAVLPYNGHIFAIDHWRGSPGTKTEAIAKEVDIYSIFKQQMIDNGVWDIVHPLVLDSVTAASIFSDETLDLVFIDADHRYEYVKHDILAWLPKVKTGGILCGHDIWHYYSEYTEEAKNAINNSLDLNAFSPVANVCIHPGVTKALYDCFDDKYTIIDRSSIWAVSVTRKEQRK